jgi:hypothetical protein
VLLSGLDLLTVSAVVTISFAAAINSQTAIDSFNAASLDGFGKIDRGHQTLTNRIIAENYVLYCDRKAQIEALDDQCGRQR